MSRGIMRRMLRDIIAHTEQPEKSETPSKVDKLDTTSHIKDWTSCQKQRPVKAHIFPRKDSTNLRSVLVLIRVQRVTFLSNHVTFRPDKRLLTRGRRSILLTPSLELAKTEWELFYLSCQTGEQKLSHLLLKLIAWVQQMLSRMWNCCTSPGTYWFKRTAIQ